MTTNDRHGIQGLNEIQKLRYKNFEENSSKFKRLFYQLHSTYRFLMSQKYGILTLETRISHYRFNLEAFYEIYKILEYGILPTFSCCSNCSNEYKLAICFHIKSMEQDFKKVCLMNKDIIDQFGTFEKIEKMTIR